MVLIATTIWLPLRANGKSIFVGIDGRAHTSAEIDATITHLMQAAEVPGLALALIINGKVVYLKAYGVKNISPNEPLTANFVMVAASLTKVAFAYLVLKLVDDHVIDLDKPVYEYLPRPLSDYAAWRDIANDPRSELITTRMLLSHTAGFNNARYFDPDHRLVIHFQPGTRYSYGSEGYNLLQLVVETHQEVDRGTHARASVPAVGYDSNQHGLAARLRVRSCERLRSIWAIAGHPKTQDRPRGRLYADDHYRLLEIDTGGPLRSRSS